MEFEVKPLPYSKDALEPLMSRETLEFHYEKHHKGYMTKLKTLIAGGPEVERSLVDVVRSSSGSVFDNAAQIWNHSFYWESMKPKGGGPPPDGDVGALIQAMGGWTVVRAELVTAGLARFGSGWAWLIVEGGKGAIITTANAETPLTTSRVPLLTVDVWEHAYYLDHRNDRKAFLEAFCDKLLNWDFVAKNLRAAR